MEFVEYKYPQKVQAYEKREMNRANATKYTFKLNSLMFEDTKRVISAPKNHKSAKEYCKGLNLAGYDDWALPSVEQLQSILNSQLKYSLKNGYWSSAEMEDRAWAVSFLTTKKIKPQKSMRFYVRCVRSAK